jgi:hypothetical protein
MCRRSVRRGVFDYEQYLARMRGSVARAIEAGAYPGRAVPGAKAYIETVARRIGVKIYGADHLRKQPRRRQKRKQSHSPHVAGRCGYGSNGRCSAHWLLTVCGKVPCPHLAAVIRNAALWGVDFWRFSPVRRLRARFLWITASFLVVSRFDPLADNIGRKADRIPGVHCGHSASSPCCTSAAENTLLGGRSPANPHHPERYWDFNIEEPSTPDLTHGSLFMRLLWKQRPGGHTSG